MLILSFIAAISSGALTQEETDKIVRQVDDAQRNNGDYRAKVFIEQKEKDKNDLVYDALVYRRTEGARLMILFTKPKAEAGKGYLRLEKNLFFYDPSVGKWERRTERERIGGTDSRRADFDESRLAEEYKARWVSEEKLGKLTVDHIELKVKEGVEVAYPQLQIWVDKATGNLVKQQEYALSGRLMRTAYYPKWDEMMSPSKGAKIHFPREIRIFDEVEKGNRTTVLVREVNLSALDTNIFTKAWLEAKSR